MDFMQHQFLARSAVQENNFEARLFCWKYFLKFYFILNKTNYARYGSYYLAVLQNMDGLYPGLKTLLKDKGLSVQAQERYPLHTAIDQRGEQTLNKDAKSVTGIEIFASNEYSVLKWTLNRPKQAENTKALLDLAGIGEEQSFYKRWRPSQIIKSEKLVRSLANVILILLIFL